MKILNTFLSLTLIATSGLAVATDPPASEPQAAAAPVASTPAPAADVPPFKIPADYKRKIVKGQVMYCTKTTTIGSRFPKTVCVDEDGLRTLIELRQSNQQDLRRAQSLCASASACSSG